MPFSISRAIGLPNRFSAAEVCQLPNATDTQGRSPKDIRCLCADAAGCRGRRATPAAFAVQEVEANAKMVNGFEGTNGAFALHDQTLVLLGTVIALGGLLYSALKVSASDKRTF
jgi:hypothetical protein